MWMLRVLIFALCPLLSTAYWYWDGRMWRPCDCNGLSNRCYFDEAMWRQTGHGGHCLDCRDSTAGPHCERCKDFYFRRTEEDRCLPCNCDSTGSENEQCDSSGRCRCKPGVTGEKCDRCMPNFYDFGPSGCRPCACLVAGSRDNNPVCLANTGVCTCKDFVEGQNCDVCKPGYFNLEEDNSYGCMACFCYGHSSICTTATGFSAKSIHTDFDSGRQRWTGVDRDGAEIATNYNGQVGNLGISAPTVTPVFFVAPDRYLGDQRFSYNQFLEFTLRLGEDGAQPSIYDVVIEGDGHTVSTPIYSQGNPVPRTIDQEFRFRLSEHQDNQWSPSLSSFDFISMLSNLTAIKIRGSYTSAGNGFLDNVRLHSARLGQGQSAVSHVEQCTCPEGYIGQFCESCGPGYHRDPRNGGPMARCVPCNCNGHSDACDVNTGECICQHNTAGENCERCAPGYYGYALAGTEDDCKQCPCPGGGECVELLNKDVVCINCQEGYTGPRCEMCADGYSGDPEGRYGPSRPCEKCTCNENIDPNAVANCNRTTGECLKCIYNTGGFYCDKCLPGYYGDALELPKGQCQACSCYVPGSVQASGNMVLCHPQTGQCPCLPNIIGRQCESCIPGYWNINSGFGCEPCRCDLTGSFNNSCEIFDGKCPCRPGIVGRRCDDCQSLHYGFSDDGCKACECDPEGSVDLQCDGRTGQCPCKPNIEGDHCDRCEENKYNITAGCIECPACYSLVQDRVHILRTKLNELRELINNIGSNPGAIDDTDFRQRIAAVNATVSKLLEDARAAIGSDGPLADQLLVIQEALMNLMNQCGRITDDVSQARTSSQASMYDISGAERAIEDAERALRDAESYIETEGQEALRQAREAQEKFGQQSLRMTDIAKQARQEAERQEEEAKRIEDTAKKALNTSQEALAIAREALQKPQDTARDIDDLRRDVTDSERLYDQTKAMSERALKQAEDAYQDSLDILTEADSVELPDIDVESQTDEAQNIKDEAQRIKEEADRLIDQHRDLMDDVFQQQTDAEDMLENGIRQQQIADELLADADVARDIARDAIAKAEKTLEDAYDTLETLKGFDEKVQKSKSAAEDALKRIPNIERQIQEAELKTRDAENNLAGAEADANMARDIAQEARNVAEMASEDADDVRGEAAKTKQRAVELKDKADDLSKDVEDLERRLRELENQAADDERLAKEALEKADQAKISAEDSSSKVSGALDDVNDILDKLANLNSIDTDRLDDLEKNLEDAEQRLIEANLEQRYNSLLVAVQQQTQWSRNYNDELGKLRLDVQNIEKINETIPRDCFRGLELEPTDPSQAGRQRRNHRRRNRNRFFS